MQTANGTWDYRIPPWLHRVIQEHKNPVFDGVFWNPPQPYVWKNPVPPRPADLRIYEVIFCRIPTIWKADASLLGTCWNVCN